MKSKEVETIRHRLKKEMRYLHQHFGVEQVALFGAFARKDATEDSDIDLVVS